MAGSSAAGLTSYAAASKRPSHLKAIIAQVGPVNNYNANIYEGQAFEWERALYWPLMQVPGFSPSHIKGLGLSDQDLQAAKELRDVIFNDVQKYLLTESKWWMRLPLLNYPSLSVLYPIINEMMSHPTQDDFRDNQDFGKSIEIPTLHLITWYDMFCSGVLEAFKTIQERVGTQQKLFIGPGGHMAVYQPDFWPFDPFFTWFDYWLKGIDTGIMDEPPIYYYHIGSQKWRYTDLWPPPSVEYKQYYLHSDGVLSTNAPSSGEPSLSYVYDPRNPVINNWRKGLYIPVASFDRDLLNLAIAKMF